MSSINLTDTGFWSLNKYYNNKIIRSCPYFHFFRYEEVLHPQLTPRAIAAHLVFHYKQAGRSLHGFLLIFLPAKRSPTSMNPGANKQTQLHTALYQFTHSLISSSV
jgi:hypothetical protein